MAFLGLITWSLFVDACRLLSICVFLLCSLTLNWYSFTSFILIIVSLYVLDRNKYDVKKSTSLSETGLPGGNPYRRKRRIKDEEKIPPEVKEKFLEQIMDFVLYDVENCRALLDFEPVKRNTECIFSRKSKLWGACDYDRTLSVEQNVVRSIPALMKFLAIGSHLHLDGFVFALPGDEFGEDPQQFGQGVRRVLKCISDHDPAGFHCMNKSYLSKIGWSFEFDGIPIFVTTFAPCYPETHARYAFGAENSFILIQPMYSFAIHDIGPDTPHTNWECPVTPRDKIRVAYKANHRPYHIRDTVIYPAAHDIVKPLQEGVGDLVEWWVDPSQRGKEEGGDVEEEVETESEGDEDSPDDSEMEDSKKEQ